MANSDAISSFIDRTGIKQDKEFMVAALQEVYDNYKKIEGLKIDLRGFNTSAGLTNTLKQAAAAQDALSKSTQTFTKNAAQFNNQVKETNQSLLSQVKATTELTKAKRDEAKATADSVKQKAQEKKAVDQAINDYAQLSKAYNDAALKYKNYALTLGENHPVTQQALKDANDIGVVLRRLDSNVGQFQRNVGNYKSAFDGLGFSFTQVARELPSLAISVQQFALAISNNLPMVADELAKAKTEIAALKAEGKDAPSLFSRISGAIFSWQVGLSIAITVVTAFSKQIVEMIGSLFGAKQSFDDTKIAAANFHEEINRLSADIDDFKASLDLSNDIANFKAQLNGATPEQADLLGIKASIETNKGLIKILNGQADEAIENIARIRSNVRANLSKQGKELFDEYVQEASKIPAEFISQLSKTDQELLSHVTDAEKGYEVLVEKRAKLNEQITRSDLQLQLKEKQLNDQRKKDAKDRAEDFSERNREALHKITLLEIEDSKKRAKEIFENDKASFSDRFQALQTFLLMSKKEIEENQRFDLGKKGLTPIEKELINTEATFKMADAIHSVQLSLEGLIAKQEEEYLVHTPNMAKEWDKSADSINKKILESSKARLKIWGEEDDQRTKEIKEKQQEILDFTARLGSEISTFAFSLLDAQLDRQRNALQDQINLIEERKAKEIEAANQSILNAQDKAAAIAVIEARAQAQTEALQRRQKQLDEQKARYDKQKAIVDIIQNTAIQIVKAIDKPFLIPLIAAIGAAQLATVISQPIPHYRTGKNVDDAYEGPAIVGDGGRKEAIIRENGKVEITPSKPTLTFVKSKDIILPDADVLMRMTRRATDKVAAAEVSEMHVVDLSPINDTLNKNFATLQTTIANKKEIHFQKPSMMDQVLRHKEAHKEYFKLNGL